MNLELLNKLIVLCEESGASVRAVVFDMGNHGIMKELEVFKRKKHFFPNPAKDRKVFLFPDTPHCLKNLRSHILDSEMIFNKPFGDQVNLSKTDFENLLQADSGDFQYCPKLSLYHISVTGSERQRVRPAVQLLSATVAEAMVYLLGDEYKDKADLIITIDKWFDTMNSRSMYNNRHARCGLGKNSYKLCKSESDLNTHSLTQT